LVPGGVRGGESADVAEVENGDLTTVARKREEDEVRVLFVEDDPAVAQMYRLKLELDGYAVDVASSSTS
jgi:hypothetical protein